MMNATEVRAMVTAYNARENEKKNVIAKTIADDICEQIKEIANNGGDRAIIEIEGNLLDKDIRAKVRDLFNTNGFYTDSDLSRKKFTIIW